jgi:hypothetical protein
VTTQRVKRPYIGTIRGDLLDADRLPLRDDRPEPGALVERVARAEAFDERGQQLHEVAVDLGEIA